MEVPLVSIIIPVFNCQEFLAETIKSALNQTWLNKEIIIVDDGSMDGSLTTAKKFENGTVRVFHQKNRGASAARNYGISAAKGEYIQFLDADDIIPADKIEKQLSILEHNSNCLIGCSWVRFYSSIENTFGGIGPPDDIQCDLTPVEWLLKRQMMCLHSWLVPRNLIEKAGSWDEALTYNDDGEFFYRIVGKAEKILFCKSTIAYYRTEKNRNSISILNSKKKYHSAYLAALTYKKIVSKLTNNSIEGKIAIGNCFKELEYMFYPDHIDLVGQCRLHSEIKLATIKFKSGRLTTLLSRILGWRCAKRIRKLFR